MPDQITRRSFLSQTAAVGVLAIGCQSEVAQAESSSPNERLNIAAVGATGRAGANIRACASQNIVAIADIDSELLLRGAQPYPGARRYEDFRVMLEKESEAIDAVIVATADHTHASAAAMAMRMKKHVYCEKPLTHTVYEARVLAELAKQNNLVTQMGTQVHAGDNYRRVVELVQSGAIGQVREVHVWVGVNYTDARFTKPKAKPNHVNWDLWLGPAEARPYCEATVNGELTTVHNYHWRWFWDFGTGGLGDLGCHYMDLPFWALDLRAPTKVSTSGPQPHPESATAGLVVEYEFPARGEQSPVTMTWYDGGKQPKQVQTLNEAPKDQNGKPMRLGNGQLFVGEHGWIISNYGQHCLLPEEDFADFKRPDPFIPKSIGHHNEWINAIKTNGPTTCNFDYSGALTEAVLLGVASYRSGETIEWDAEKLKATNSEKAQQFIHTDYRKGWTL